MEGNTKALCIICMSSDSEDKLTRLTDKNFIKLKQCSMRWHKLGEIKYQEACEQLENINSFSSSEYGFHRKCYQFFTNIAHIERREKSKVREENDKLVAGMAADEEDEEDEDNDNLPEERKITLRKRMTDRTATTPKHILPAICLICNKRNLFYKHHGKSCRDKLVNAETLDGGMYASRCRVFTHIFYYSLFHNMTNVPFSKHCCISVGWGGKGSNQ